MIDTFEIYIKVTKKQKMLLKEAIDGCIESINSTSPKKSKKLHWENKALKTAAFNRYGVLELKFVLVNEGDLKRTWFMIKIKPSIALHTNDVYALSKENDYIIYRRIFREFIIFINKYVHDEFTLLPCDINNWTLNRIDYAFQFMTHHYKEYMYLIKKVAQQEKRREYKNSLYIIEKSHVINFYDKTQKNMHYSYNEDELDKHVIRFEVQCKKEYLQRLKKDYGISLLNLESFWDIHLARETVLNKMNKYIKGGDYYNITSGKRILSKLYGQTKVQKLVLLLECSIHNSTLLESLPFLYSNISRGEVTAKQVKRNLLPALSKAGINPLAIPNSWNIEILLNPTKLITDF